VPRYRIVPERSHVWVDAQSNVHPIHSSTDGLEGYLDLQISPDGGIDTSEAPAGKLSLPVSRLSSGNRLEDREMQKRIDAQRYPTIDGALEKMERSGNDGSYKVRGDITFRGVARTYEDEMTLDTLSDGFIKLVGKSRFDIRDFGMDPPRALMLRVDPEVDVRVEIVAEKEA
jgi:polyisoprenoid-binding protein YceI